MLHLIVIHPQILEKLMKLYENTYFSSCAAILRKSHDITSTAPREQNRDVKIRKHF